MARGRGVWPHKHVASQVQGHRDREGNPAARAATRLLHPHQRQQRHQAVPTSRAAVRTFVCNGWTRMCKDLPFRNIPCPTVATARPHRSFFTTNLDEESDENHVPFHLAAHNGAMSLTLCIKPIEIGAQTHCVYRSMSMLLERPSHRDG